MCKSCESHIHSISLVWGVDADRPNNMLVYLRDGSAQTIVCAATPRQKLQAKLSFPNHSILASGQPIPALNLYRQAPGRGAPGVLIFKSHVLFDQEESPMAKARVEPRSTALEADTFAIRPPRWLEGLEQKPHMISHTEPTA